ncbi:hypothetical protein PILCRDRAFT_459073 [Piloderma croceum F 1598]|uniref:Glycoside hydrolase family 16 protein n=1 Tax=Piloderma croceum (strain F 1598) TaxID=765440 RepID=A0A0C3FWN1_PILCF|nr:hypothetical protein PILCRDRAFT_459073 [Piloderma croceum F 1598]
MDPNAVNQNITVDDFDSVVTYADQGQWSTPNPQLLSNDSVTPWKDGTYHLTNITNASFTFDFEGPTFFIYGAAGPAYGSFEISLDGSSSVSTAHASQNVSGHLLFSNTTLEYANHTLKMTNLGAQNGDDGGNQFLFDYLQFTVQLAPEGASVKNTTVQETDSALTFNGNWTTNVFNPLFSGGGSKYTNADGATVSLSFYGSTIYIFGDKVDDHGLFSVTLDNRTAQQFDGVSGCGGAFRKYCEKDNTLAYFASNLDSSLHTVTLQNNAGVNHSFFDLDAMVYTTPSEYAVRQPPTSSSGSGSSSSASSSLSSAVPGMNLLLLLFLNAVWLGRSCRRWL